mmetsp:Transcript_71698/g.191276  ORF Transcript_71698/g.191276 Transcript_71698/m.191276 type:complete len:133 (-) Transcript_71698:98-496(-)
MMESLSLSEDKHEAFQTLQAKYGVVRRQLGIVSSQLSYAEMEKQRNKLTLVELEKLPEGTATYKAIGKMFLLVPSSRIIGDCQEAVAVADTRIGEFTGQKTALEKTATEVENSIRDIIMAARDKPSVASKES